MNRFSTFFLVLCLGSMILQSQVMDSHAAENSSSPLSDARFARLAKGVNLPGWLWLENEPIGEVENRLTDDQFSFLHSLGLTHIRIPIEFKNIYDEDQPDLLNQDTIRVLDRAIDKINGFGLAVIVDLHSIRLGETGASDYSGPLDKDPAFVNTFIQFWSSLAKHLSRHDPEGLFLEPMNEPVFSGHPELWIPIQKKLIQAIRQNAPNHTILATSAQWSSIYTFIQLQPLDDPNVVYNFHFYLPFYFTHQGATWSSENVKSMRHVPYPSSPERVQKAVDSVKEEENKKDLRNYGEERWDAIKIDQEIAKAAEWAKNNRVRITCNEFGAYRRFAPEADRVQWMQDVREAFEKYNIGWTMWDIDGGFGAFSRENGRLTITPEMQNAMGLVSVPNQ